MLKLKIADLRRSLQIVTSQAGQLSDLKREVRRLQKELLEEKTKVGPRGCCEGLASVIVSL